MTTIVKLIKSRTAQSTCNQNCNQGRNCTCAPKQHSKFVTGLIAMFHK